GPIRLCDAGPGAMAAHRPADPSPHGLQGHDGHEPTSVSLPDGAHDHDDPSANHHGWERCSLGGLASLAAIAGDWHFALPHVRPAHVAPSDGAAADRRTVFAFRSRAPPLAHA
ncbi:MAG: hypothetical protein JXB36_17605, partial [Gammaproteobacteria bacterium]|nr:hypothetical protein [Gammaproteobacteria bacterium]